MNHTFRRLVVSFVIAMGVYAKSKGVLGWQKPRDLTKIKILKTSSISELKPNHGNYHFAGFLFIINKLLHMH